MSGEVANWLASSPMQRQHDRNLAKIGNEVTIARVKVYGMATVAHDAMTETLGLSMLQRQAELMLPEVAPKLEYIQMQAVVAMGGVLNRMAGQW